MRKLGYLNLINTNGFALKTIKMIMVLPLLPAEKIEEGFVVIKRYAARHSINMRRLFNYYERYNYKLYFNYIVLIKFILEQILDTKCRR